MRHICNECPMACQDENGDDTKVLSNLLTFYLGIHLSSSESKIVDLSISKHVDRELGDSRSTTT